MRQQKSNLKVTTKSIEQTIGKLSKPSKMPGHSWSIPATKCLIGSILRTKQGSVCSKCYALKGRYVFPNVQKAMNKRFEALKDLNRWQTLMTELIRRKTKKVPYFRFFDSGDIQSLEHLAAIVNIAKALPDVKFWVPTKETEIIKSWIRIKKIQKKRFFPKNMVVRLSAPMIGATIKPPKGILTSTVSANKGFLCEAPKRGGHCGPCRACWNPQIKSVDYKKH